MNGNTIYIHHSVDNDQEGTLRGKVLKIGNPFKSKRQAGRAFKLYSPIEAGSIVVA
jgi:hypothetical protein